MADRSVDFQAAQAAVLIAFWAGVLTGMVSWVVGTWIAKRGRFGKRERRWLRFWAREERGLGYKHLAEDHILNGEYIPWVYKLEEVDEDPTTNE